jgi:hypothetical protein
MNERIGKLAEQAGLLGPSSRVGNSHEATERFAELIVRDHINILRQEWYALNNAPAVKDESARDVAIRVGRKTEIIVLIEKIKQYFGVEE